ncbi:MAG: hypothetical protein ACREV7_03215 [Steroidobacteraceae bacterium]
MRVALGARSLAALILMAGVTGCATQKADPPPLLDLSAFNCGQAPVLAGAPTLVYDPQRHKSQTTADVTAASSCFKDSVGSSLYLAYELPSVPTSYLVRVDSEPEGATLMALRVLLYGSDGSLKRAFSRKQIVFHGHAESGIWWLRQIPRLSDTNFPRCGMRRKAPRWRPISGK